MDVGRNVVFVNDEDNLRSMCRRLTGEMDVSRDDDENSDTSETLDYETERDDPSEPLDLETEGTEEIKTTFKNNVRSLREVFNEP